MPHQHNIPDPYQFRCNAFKVQPTPPVSSLACYAVDPCVGFSVRGKSGRVRDLGFRIRSGVEGDWRGRVRVREKAREKEI